MGLSDRQVFCHISGALLLGRKQSSLVHVGSSVIFVAGHSQILGTDNKCRVVVAHSSKLLIEFSGNTARQHCHVLAVNLTIP